MLLAFDKPYAEERRKLPNWNLNGSFGCSEAEDKLFDIVMCGDNL